MEDGLQWFKSSFSSGNGQCVECAHLPDGGMAIRDTKNREEAVLRFSGAEWGAFIAALRAGQFG